MKNFLKKLLPLFLLLTCLFALGHQAFAGGSSSASSGVANLYDGSYGWRAEYKFSFTPCEDDNINSAKVYRSLWNTLERVGVKLKLHSSHSINGILECGKFPVNHSGDMEYACQITVVDIDTNDIEAEKVKGKRFLIDDPKTLVSGILEKSAFAFKHSNVFKAKFKTLGIVVNENAREDSERFWCYAAAAGNVYFNIIETHKEIPAEDIYSAALKIIPRPQDKLYVVTGLLNCNAVGKNGLNSWEIDSTSSCTIQIGDETDFVNNPEKIINELIKVKPIKGYIYNYKAMFELSSHKYSGSFSEQEVYVDAVNIL